MARIGSNILDTNDVFPELDFQVISGETLNLPNGIGQGYGTILFYRGYW